jgi:hypothetical protein
MYELILHDDDNNSILYYYDKERPEIDTDKWESRIMSYVLYLDGEPIEIGNQVEEGQWSISYESIKEAIVSDIKTFAKELNLPVSTRYNVLYGNNAPELSINEPMKAQQDTVFCKGYITTANGCADTIKCSKGDYIVKTDSGSAQDFARYIVYYTGEGKK